MTGSPGGMSQFCFCLLLRLLLQVFHQAIVGCWLIFILVYVFGNFLSWTLPFFLLPSVAFGFSSPSSSSMASYHSLLGSVFCCVLYAFSSRFSCLGLHCFRPSCPLSFSWIPPWFFFVGSFLCLGSPFIVSLSSCSLWFFHAWFLRVRFLGPFLGPFSYALINCASSLECLFRQWALPSLPIFQFLSPCSPSNSPFLYALRFFSTHWLLRSFPLLLLFLLLLFLLLPHFLRGLLLFLSRVQYSWICCFSWCSVHEVVVLTLGFSPWSWSVWPSYSLRVLHFLRALGQLALVFAEGSIW